jgi:hypothetical protein
MDRKSCFASDDNVVDEDVLCRVMGWIFIYLLGNKDSAQVVPVEQRKELSGQIQRASCRTFTYTCKVTPAEQLQGGIGKFRGFYFCNCLGERR